MQPLGLGGALRPPLPAWLIGVLLTVIPLLTLSHHFAYHAPSALGPSLEKFFKVDEEDRAWLFTMYSAPNILLVLVGGLLMDRVGLVRTSLGFNLCVLLGMVVFACAPAGAGDRSMRYLLAGRFLLGMGGECIATASQAMLARWFKRSSWLTFAMGWHAALVQLLGSAPAFLVLPLALGSRATEVSLESGVSDDGGNVRLCLWIIVAVCGASLLSNCAYALLELRYGSIFVASEAENDFELQMDLDILRLEQRQQQQKKKASAKPLPRKPANAPKHSSKQGGAYAIVQSDHIEEVEVEPASPSASLTHSRDADGQDEPASQRNLIDGDEEEAKEQDSSPDDSSNGNGAAEAEADGMERARAMSDQVMSPSGGGSGIEHAGLLSGLSNLLRHHEQGGSPLTSVWKPWQAMRGLPPLFWLCLAMHCLLSPVLYTFSAFGPAFFAEKYNLSPEESSALTSLLYVAFVVAPLCGAAIDRIGYRAIVQCAVAALIPLLFLALHISRSGDSLTVPYVLMSLLGVSFALTESNGLAMIADCSPSGLLGTAYALVGVGTSVCLLFEPYVVGALHLHTRRYSDASWLFIGVTFAGWVASFAVYVFDVNHDNLMTLAARRGAEVADGRALHGGGGGGAAGSEMELAPAYPELDIVFDDDARGSDADEQDELRLDEFDLAGLP